jgi:hypothetical protein
MRSFVVALAALAFAAAASAASPAEGPYHLDSNGRCRAAGGQSVIARLCTAPPSHPYCKPGVEKPCGKTCIALDKTCHVH